MSNNDAAQRRRGLRVRVETFPCPNPLPHTDELDLRELTVALASDVGGRMIADAQGQAIPLRQSGP